MWGCRASLLAADGALSWLRSAASVASVLPDRRALRAALPRQPLDAVLQRRSSSQVPSGPVGMISCQYSQCAIPKCIMLHQLLDHTHRHHLIHSVPHAQLWCCKAELVLSRTWEAFPQRAAGVLSRQAVSARLIPLTQSIMGRLFWH